MLWLNWEILNMSFAYFSNIYENCIRIITTTTPPHPPFLAWHPIPLWMLNICFLLLSSTSRWVLGLVKPEQMLTSAHDLLLRRCRCTIKTANGRKGNINAVVLYCMGDSVHREGEGPWCKKWPSSLCGHSETCIPGDWRAVRWRLEKKRKDTGRTTELSQAGWSRFPVLQRLSVLMNLHTAAIWHTAKKIIIIIINCKRKHFTYRQILNMESVWNISIYD